MKNHKKIAIILYSLVILLVLSVLSGTVGSVSLSISDIIGVFTGDSNEMAQTILFQMRLPRAMIAILVGANLAVAGALLQSVMKNPLADPGVTGVSSGASVFAIIVLLLFPQYTSWVPVAAFVGGAFACIVVYGMAWKRGIQPLRIILAGVAVNSVLGGIISLLSILYSDRIQSALLWLNGSLSGKTWNDAITLLIYSMIGLSLAALTIRQANLLQLGDDVAFALGTRVNLVRILVSGVAVFIVAVSTSVVGIISFVGLIVPHMARMWLGSDYKYIIPFSMVLGGIVVLVADTLGRTIGGALEIPVGVIMAVVGGPFFLYLLRKKGVS